MTSTWHIEQDVGVTRDSLPAPAGSTVSLAFIGATLRRLWYVWLGCMLLGAALAAGYLVLVPPQSVGTVSLLLAHDPSTQPDAALGKRDRHAVHRADAVVERGEWVVNILLEPAGELEVDHQE